MGKSGLVHLEDEGTLLNEDLRAEESRRVVGESVVVARLPSGEIEEIEVVSPVQIEHAGLLVIVVHLNIVVHCIPWHIDIIKSDLPLGELRGPEVHHKRLWFADQFDCWVKFTVCAYLATVNRPSDEVRGPFNLIYMPVIGWVKTINVSVGLTPPSAITVDDICADWMLSD